jgi:Na+/H+-dicarboxylate symporter
MSTTGRVLVGLAAGLTAGALAAITQHPALLAVAPVVAPVGTLWLSALRMTVIPLLVSLLVTGIAAANEAAAAGRLGARMVSLVFVLLFASSAFSAVITPALLALQPIAPATVATLRAGMARAPEVAPAVTSLAQWMTDLVPSNAIRAASDGAILPLVVFSLLLGLAAARLGEGSRDYLLGFFRALGDAMLLIVQWVLRLAPLGVFGLVFPFGVSAGVRTIGALAHYVLLLVGLCILATLALYPIAALGGRMSLRRFAGGAAPAQAVALSTRSSLASLPAMLEAARTRLGLPPGLAGVALPLAATLMRFTNPLVNIAHALFVAALFGIDLSVPQIAAGVVVAVAASLAGVGLPSEVNFMATNIPVFQVMGLPLEPLALLIAVDAIPDMFMTVGNVTADLTATSIVARGSRVEEEAVETAPMAAMGA